MSELRGQLSRRVVSLRKRADMSQEGLAQAAGIGLDAVGRLERGEVTPSLETIQRIAQVFQLDLAEFFRLEDTKATNPVHEELDALSGFLATKPLPELRFLHRLVRSASGHMDEMRLSQR